MLLTRPADTVLPTRSFGVLMASLVRTSSPELSGALGRIFEVGTAYMMSSPLPRATIGSRMALPPNSALPPNTASTAIAPCAMVVQVTLRFSSVKKPLSRATISGVKLVTDMVATRTLAGAGLCACAPDRLASMAMKTPHRPRRDAFIISSWLSPPAAFVMPPDQPAFGQQEDPVQHVTQQRQHEYAGIHVRHLESPLRQQRKVAQSVIRHDHLAEDCQDQ